MVIRIRPTPGDVVLINKKYFDDNILISQYFPDLKPGVPYLVDEVLDMPDHTSSIPVWGISRLKDVSTGDVIDINSEPALEEFWCLLVNSDSYRVIPQ